MLGRIRKLCSQPGATLRARVFALRHNRALRRAPLDPAVRYPCYASLDTLLDIPRLKALDAGLREALRSEHTQHRHPRFETTITRRWWDARGAATRMVHLTAAPAGTPYLHVDQTELWQPTDAAERFAFLMAFVRTLPFEHIGRVVILYDVDGKGLVAHRDHWRPDRCHEFVWLRSNLDRPLFVQSATTGVKAYVRGHSAWFDTVNQFHGSDAAPGLTFAVRVDGVFDDALRRHLPPPPAANRASWPALWAAREAQA